MQPVTHVATAPCSLWPEDKGTVLLPDVGFTNDLYQDQTLDQWSETLGSKMNMEGISKVAAQQNANNQDAFVLGCYFCD
jgi:hypothetical protein